uniref:Kinesin-like protein unc-104 n=1 Tax=Romanomermis culicivorax TaxID=13658 RepID=A0A915IE80_ROMCU
MTKTSCINLVDLAGSERQAEAGTEGDRLKEGIVINQSLSTLGRCIKALADQQKGKSKAGTQIPFRDSILTSLLKNALGGNSKTVMIAALSPADINYEETLSTLRFADRAKSIKTTAVVNESATDRLIRELREENQRLTSMLGANGGINNIEEVEVLRQQLEQNKKEMVILQQTWQQRLAEENSLGTKDKSNIDAQRKTVPHLWNLNEDPALTNVLVYFLKTGESKVGNSKAKPPADIVLNGLSIQPQHAIISNEENRRILIKPIASAKVLVNGAELKKEQELYHNDRILFGTNHLFILAHPVNLEERKNKEQTVESITYDMAQSEIAETTGLMSLARKVSNGLRTKEDFLLEEELVRVLPQIYQANAISEELKKAITFEIVLVAPQTRGLTAGSTEAVQQPGKPGKVGKKLRLETLKS